jgi:hypothetical protein
MSEAKPETDPSALSHIWTLTCLAREARSDRELGFLLVNQTQVLAPYRQAVLWLQNEGVYTLSGVVQMEANAPYVQWVQQVAQHLWARHADAPCTLTARDLPHTLSKAWADWWPAHLLWLPQRHASDDRISQGGSLWLRDEPWEDITSQTLLQWSQAWWHAFRNLHRPQLKSLAGLKQRLLSWLKPKINQAWYRQRRFQLAAGVLATLCFPIRLSVLAPGELVPSHPLVMRSPLEAVIDTFHVQPNQVVTKDQLLFSFDQTLIRSRVELAQQMLATAETDYRQTTQQALTDAKAKAQLSLLAGKIEEKRAELSFAAEQQERARVLAPQAGIVLMDDPSEWIGKPVAVGERILRIAAPGDSEVEVWIPLADAITLPEGAEVSLYLHASPLSPVPARVRYLAHDAIQRPDGIYAYRLRATLTEPTQHRVGLKGTARVHGNWVPLVYWLARRPLAALRATLGI